MELEGKCALVTGGGRGIGRAIAAALSCAGADVAIIGRTEATLRQTAAALGGHGRRVWHGVADVGVPAQVEQVVQTLAASWGHLDILVNNAGVQGPIGPLVTTPADRWWDAVRTNLLGCYACCRAVLPGMLERGYGKIVNLSGGGAVTPRPRYSAYSASKAAVVRLTETLAAELAGTGIEPPGRLPTCCARWAGGTRAWSSCSRSSARACCSSRVA